MNHLVYKREHGEPNNPEDQNIVMLLMSKGRYYKDWTTFYELKKETIPKGQFFDVSPENMIQIKINYYPNTSEIYEYDYHHDYPFSHIGAVLSLNTCDGYTKLRETDKKYPSVENTLVLHDASKDHLGTSTTNTLGRFNVNLNYQE